jgi:CubicO group peptidase (beta-lactamase class C family)
MCRSLLFAAILASATAAAPAMAATRPADYAGTYDGGIDGPTEIVAANKLFAVVMEARYPLTEVAPDILQNSLGLRLQFKREGRRLIGYTQAGVFHPRLSNAVSPASLALARPRPAGEDDPQSYTYRAPVDMHDGIPVGDLADTALGRDVAQTIVTGILRGAWQDVDGILLFKDNKLVMEEYFHGYSAARPHQLRSATKSVVSAVIGSAVQAGALSGPAERVLPRMPYPSYLHPDPRKARLTLGDLLTMQPGLDCNDHSDTSPGRETLVDEQPDWVKATLDLPMIATPGTQGTYCSGGVAVAGRLTEHAVHETLPEYAATHLFAPLGIRRADWRWNYTLTNANREYAQIHLRPRDMLKLGIVYANGGTWHGQRILPASWVAASLAAQSRVEGADYGYFWWHPYFKVAMPDGERRVPFSAAQGNGGQKIYLFPQFDLVAVVTAGAYNAPTPSNAMMVGVVLPKLLAAEQEQEQAQRTPAAATPAR